MITQQSVIQDDGRNIKRNLKKKKDDVENFEASKVDVAKFRKVNKKSNDLVLSYECIYLIGIDSFTRV